MSTCEVSVVIPAYNAERFIVDALASIALQTCRPKEVIVIDDGSSDNTSLVIEKWIANADIDYPVYLSRQENCGISATRNNGIRHATSQWVAFLDADDIWEEAHLAELMAATLLAPTAIAAYGAGKLLVKGVRQDVLYDDFWDNPSKKLGAKIDDSPCYVLDSTIIPRLVKGNFIKPSSLMIARARAHETGLFNEALGTAEDREFLVRLVAKGNFVYCSLPITQYRWHDDNASQVKNAKRNMENGLIAIKMIRDNRDLALSSAQLVSCGTEIKLATKGYLFVCSQDGTTRYLKGLQFISNLFGLSKALLALNPKHVVRCLLPKRRQVG